VECSGITPGFEKIRVAFPEYNAWVERKLNRFLVIFLDFRFTEVVSVKVCQKESSRKKLEFHLDSLQISGCNCK